MIFPAPRVIVIDDDPVHLQGLVDGLRRYGTACLPMHFVGDPAGFRKCPDVRLIFADLHLNEGGAGGDYERHFAILGGLIEETFSPAGPYVLVLWTRYPEQASGLGKFLETRLDGVAKPLAVVSLEKSDHLDLSTGNVKDPSALVAAIASLIEQQPQLAVLLNWEERVMGAVADCVTAVLRMTNSAPDPSSRCKELARLFALFAAAGVGQRNMDRDRFQAVNEVLLPILADRIAFLIPGDRERGLWMQAFEAGDAGAAITLDEAAALNRLLHIAESDDLRGADRGAVIVLPVRYQGDGFQQHFGITESEAALRQFGCSGFTAGDDSCRWVLVQSQAACDYAQRQAGPVPYLLAMELSCSKRAANRTLPAAIWKSPVLKFRGAPAVLNVNCRFQLSLPPDEAAAARALYRLREQLLNTLIVHAHAYGARPGVISFDER